jgi:hypothetical protein
MKQLSLRTLHVCGRYSIAIWYVQNKNRKGQELIHY